MRRSYIKKLVSSATSLVMLISCFAGVITASAETKTWNLVEGSITATLDDKGVFTVTGKGDMPSTYTATNRPYQNEITNITSVVISSGITSIGKFTFPNCSNLVKADIADTVTSIGQSAFTNCKKEELIIDIKGTLTTVGTSAFGQVKGTIKVYNQATYDLVKPKATSANVTLIADIGSLKTELQNLIKTTKETYKQEDYTPATYKTLSDALTAAESLVSQASPSTQEIQNATKAINDAISKLVSDVEGLKNDLQSAIEEARKIVTTTYTTSSVAALNKAISDAEAAIKESGVTKEKLTQAKTALETASKIDETGLAETGLKTKADIDHCNKLVKDAITRAEPSEKYTPESYAEYQKVLDKAVEFNKDLNDVTNEQIDEVLQELEAAKQKLVEADEIVLNLDEYNAAKKAVEDILKAEKSPYTKNSLDALKSVFDIQINKVEDEDGNIIAGKQNIVDNVTAALKQFIDIKGSYSVLVEKGDLTNLKALVESTNDLTEAKYTAETWKTLSDELTKANALINDPDNAIKADVEASENTLKTAIDALRYKSADYKAVDDALDKVPSDLSKYTDETVKALQNAINAVDRNKNITEQADVDAFAKAIENAIAGLKLKPSSSSQKPGPSTSTKNPGTVSGTSGKTSAKTVKSAAQLKAEKAMNQAKITKLTVKSKAKKTIVVKWNKVKNAKGYQVQVSTKRNFKKLIVNKKSLKKNKITVKNKKLKKGKKYFVRVRAYATYKNSKGVTKKAYSSWNKKLRTVKIK